MFRRWRERRRLLREADETQGRAGHFLNLASAYATQVLDARNAGDAQSAIALGRRNLGQYQQLQAMADALREEARRL